MAYTNKDSWDHDYDPVNSFLDSIDEDGEPDIETDIADLGQNSQTDTKTEPMSGKKKNKFFFGFSVFVVVMAIIGLFSSVKFIYNGIRYIADNTSLKNEFARFLLPVVANDIAPFQYESDLSDSARINCAIWNILINKDISDYKSSLEGEYLIPEYDVSVSCREIFGSGSSVEHRTVGYGNSRFTYDETNHVYSCARDLRYLNYAPRIADMTEDNGTYTITVEYLPPSFSVTAENLGLEIEPDKTMIYTVNRWDGQNTLMSVNFPEQEQEN